MKKGFIKRALSLFIACAVMLSALPCVSAKSSTELEKVILLVKSKVEIPEELTEFQSEVYTDEETGVKNYILSWYEKDAKEKYGNPEYNNELLGISLTADNNGVISHIDFEILNVYDYIYDNSEKLSGLTKEDVNKSAGELIAKYSPEYKDNLKIATTLLNGADHAVSFEYIVNDLPVEGNGATITFAELEDGLHPMCYSINIGENKNFPSPDNVIGTDKISEIIKTDNPYKLNYHNENYISRGNYELLLQYSLEDRNDTVYYNAITGEPIKPDYGIRYGQNSALKEESVADTAMTSGSGNLTEQEIAELETIEGLYSVEELEKYLKSIDVFDIPDDYKLSSSRISKQDDEYFADIAFSKEEKEFYASVSAKINAKTKEIVNFYGNSSDVAADADKENKELSEQKIAELETIADKFINTYMESKASSIEKKEKEYSKYDSSVYVTYTRTLNDIPYLNNTVGIRVNSDTKKIVGVYSNWTNLKEIPSAENVITSLQIADKVINDIGLHLCYVRIDGVPTLAYTLNKTGVNFDAHTGEMVEYNGNPISEVFSGYTDIEGHWAEEIITKLSENGVYVNSDKFMPDENIRQLDFLMFASSIDGYLPADADSLYDRLIRQNVLTDEEKAPEKLITRAEAVTYLLKMRGYSNIGDIKGVFVCGFVDDETIPDDMYGYVAIAKGLGIVQGDENNYFNPNHALKRAEAAIIIYNIMK